MLFQKWLLDSSNDTGDGARLSARANPQENSIACQKFGGMMGEQGFPADDE
jgi:hypothetical protein